MESILDTAPFYYFSFTDDGVLTFANQTLCDRLGYQKTELEGALLDRLLTLPSRIFFQTHWAPLLRLQSEVSELYITVLAKDKSALPVLMNSKRKEIHGGFINQCAAILVTNRKKYEDELLAAKKAYESALLANSALVIAKQELQEHSEQLDQSLSRLQLQNEELQQINKIVTHDLQEPIRKLFFYSDQFKSDFTGLPDSALKSLERIQSVTQKLRTIVSGLQQYIWLNDMDMSVEETDLNMILAESMRLMSQRFDSGQWKLTADELPVIRGNSEQLLAMMTHVLDNAIRFKNPNKPAAIDIRCMILEQNSFRSTAGKYRYGKHARIIITDNGVGFQNSLKDQVFALFYKMNNIAGSGLGLALSKKVVEHHHGSIEAQSEPGKGTTISITLPLNLKK